MRLRCITALITGALFATGPVLAQTPPALPMPAAIQGARVIAIDGAAQRELKADTAQVAHTEVQGSHGSNMMSSMTTNMAITAVSVFAGPIAAVAAPIVSLFNHHSAPKPTMRTLLALPGRASSNALSTAAQSFTIDYADIPGINPDAYAPELVKLTQTNDNWRVVAVSESSDPSAFASLFSNGMVPAGMNGTHEMPKITETRIDYATVSVSSRGHATIALAHTLDSGEYGIVLRPTASATDVSPASLLTVWDFSVHS